MPEHSIERELRGAENLSAAEFTGISPTPGDALNVVAHNDPSARELCHRQ